MSHIEPHENPAFAGDGLKITRIPISSYDGTGKFAEPSFVDAPKASKTGERKSLLRRVVDPVLAFVEAVLTIFGLLR